MQTQVYSIDEIREIVAPIAKQHGVDKVFLFGSYARGDATPASDVDLCVDAPKLRGLFALGGLYADLEDQDYMDSVSMNLLQIGELAGKFSDAYVQKTKPQMDWRAIKNMRNMFAHDYGSMDKDRIWQTATEDVPALKAYCERALTEDF